MKKSVITTEEHEFAGDLLDFIDDSPSSFHVVESVKKMLVLQEFRELRLEEKWSLTKGKKYFVTRNNSALIAFIIGQGEPDLNGFRLIGVHTDSPSFRVKPLSEISVGGYIKLNVETYGGPILNTWSVSYTHLTLPT